MGLALGELAADGWRVGLAVLTMPHRLWTPAPALVEACRAGLSSVRGALDDWRTPAAVAALAALKAKDLTASRRSELEAEARRGSLLWWARIELTAGKNGLHPHANVLLLIPPKASAPEGIYEGAARDPETGYVHLPALESALGPSWGAATIQALRALDPKRADSYRAADAGLADDLDDARARVDELRAAPVAVGFVADRQARALAAALLDLAKAEQAAADDSPERRALRWRGCSVVAWEGAVGAAATYALGLGGGRPPASDWTVGEEWAGPGKDNDLWRALDSDQTAALWGCWCVATGRTRLTRASRGLVDWLDRIAQDVEAGAEVVSGPERRRVAVCHPLVVQWARDCGRERDIQRAAADGVLGAWWVEHAPEPLRPLLELVPGAPLLDLDDADELRERRRRLVAAHDASGLGWGYWMGADGRPVAWVDKAGKTRTDRQPPSVAARRSARALAVLPAYDRYAETRGVKGTGALAVRAAYDLAALSIEHEESGYVV
jgi:hypothetical protein